VSCRFFKIFIAERTVFAKISKNLAITDTDLKIFLL